MTSEEAASQTENKHFLSHMFNKRIKIKPIARPEQFSQPKPIIENHFSTRSRVLKAKLKQRELEGLDYENDN